jgi:hypothetical protein
VGLWWVPIGLAAWFGVAVVAALFIGPALRRSSEAREALERQLTDMPVSLRVPPPSDGADPYTLKRNSTTSPSRMT